MSVREEINPPDGVQESIRMEEAAQTRADTGSLYLLLHAVELRHLDDERGGAAFVLDGPQQGPHVVHAEGLRPAPVAPALDADVQQLQGEVVGGRRAGGGRGGTRQTAKNTEDTRHQRFVLSASIYPPAKGK